MPDSGHIDFCPLASGSSGNCSYIGTRETGILVDAGLSGVRIENALRSVGAEPNRINAVFITHEHSDHIAGAGVLARRYGLSLYATEGTWEAIDEMGTLGKIPSTQRKTVRAGEYITFRDLLIRPFNIPHDAAGPVGYNVFHGDTAESGVKVTVATDMGHISPESRDGIMGSDVLLIESNHDIDMLKNGRYPFHLKKRILGDKGHLSNVSCGQILAEIAESGVKHVYLGHMSEENNEPMLAYETVRGILQSNGVAVNEDHGGGVSLRLADRYRVSRLIRLSLSKMV